MPVHLERPEDHPHVALVTLDRPDRANALDPAMLTGLARAWRKIAEDPDIRVAILRTEQLYPFPQEDLTRELRAYPEDAELVWVQEEPMNQGAWYAIQHWLRSCRLPAQSLSYTGRLSSAAPAGGMHAMHRARQERLVEAALNLQWTDPSPIRIFKPQRVDALETTRR